jgi:hypothetical protein
MIRTRHRRLALLLLPLAVALMAPGSARAGKAPPLAGGTARVAGPGELQGRGLVTQRIEIEAEVALQAGALEITYPDGTVLAAAAVVKGSKLALAFDAAAEAALEAAARERIRDAMQAARQPLPSLVLDRVTSSAKVRTKGASPSFELQIDVSLAGADTSGKAWKGGYRETLTGPLVVPPPPPLDPDRDVLATRGSDVVLHVQDVLPALAAGAQARWNQTLGTRVRFSAHATGIAFTAPDDVGALLFELEVREGKLARTLLVMVHVVQDASRAVFVGPFASSQIWWDPQAPPGSVRNPYFELGDAVSASPPGADFYLNSSMRSTYPVLEFDRVPLGADASLFGGYDASWIRDPELRRTALQVNPVSPIVLRSALEPVWFSGFDVESWAIAPLADRSGDIVLVEARGDAAGSVSVTIENSTIESRASSGPGKSSYGLVARALDALAIRRSVIAAGHGSDGPLVSTPPSSTATGARGADASGSQGGCSSGRGTCGGDGGAGGGIPGYQSGGDGAGFGGGAGGVRLPFRLGAEAGADGLVTGVFGNGGVIGTSGQPAGPLPVAVDPGGLPLTRDGGAGGAGRRGDPGYGGGGGYNDNFLLGGGGGQGGQGGAGGAGGGGGGGGGHSVGVLIHDVRELSIESSAIRAGAGGKGADGGRGGAGASGGPGGAGAPGASFAGISAGSGAAGGRGARGGTGGGGGGGMGGSSFGVLLVGAARLESGLLRDTLVQSDSGGQGGRPGATGESIGVPVSAAGGWSYPLFATGPLAPGAIALEGATLLPGAPGPGGAPADWQPADPGPPGQSGARNF